MYEITCHNCKTNLPLKVCKSAAGYYVGYFCPECGPHGRYSGYLKSRKEAEILLVSIRKEIDEINPMSSMR